MSLPLFFEGLETDLFELKLFKIPDMLRPEVRERILSIFSQLRSLGLLVSTEWIPTNTEFIRFSTF